MVESAVPPTLVDEANMVAERSESSPCASNKNQGKPPKKIHKAEREKLKREQLNELFLELADALEVAEQNNGKAFVLNEATRLLKSMVSQIECLRRENADLLSESHYMTMEKNELKDETSTLQAQIEKLQSEVEARVFQSRPDLNMAPSDIHHPELASQDPLRLPDPTSQQAPIMGPVFVVPIDPDHPAYKVSDAAQLKSMPPSNVRKPHARYPNPADSWPFRVLEMPSNVTKESRHSSGHSSCSTEEEDPANI